MKIRGTKRTNNAKLKQCIIMHGRVKAILYEGHLTSISGLRETISQTATSASKLC